MTNGASCRNLRQANDAPPKRFRQYCSSFLICSSTVALGALPDSSRSIVSSPDELFETAFSLRSSR